MSTIHFANIVLAAQGLQVLKKGMVIYMYDMINQQLEEARQKLFRLQKVKSMIEERNIQKKQLERKASEFKEILEKEEIDVEKLEGKSLTHIFHSVLGNLQDKLQKEQQEALAAQLKYDQAVRDLGEINQELYQLAAEKFQYEGSESQYQELYDKKKELLLQSNSSTAGRISELTEQISAEQNVIKEIREAINAGANVTQHLKNTSDSLDSAEGWGTWDLLGGGLVTDMIKHGHIDDAKAEAEQTQMALLRFKTELADIRIDSNINIDTDGFAKFADFFFDGLIADWCMQSRIHDSQDSVESVQNQVQTVLFKLSSMEQSITEHIERLQREINELIVSA